MDGESANALVRLLVFLQGTGLFVFGSVALKFHIDKQKLKLQRDREAAEAKRAAGELKIAEERLKAETRREDRTLGLQVEKHRDDLAIQLLGAAREEIAVLRLQIENHRISDSETDVYAQHFETALGHLEALLLADNPSEAKLARRAARAFLNRMRRMQEARGAIANERQRLESRSAVIHRHGDDHGPGSGNGSDLAGDGGGDDG